MIQSKNGMVSMRDVLVSQSKKVVESFRNGYHNPALKILPEHAIKPFEVFEALTDTTPEDIDPVVEAKLATYYKNFIEKTTERLEETDRSSMPTWVRTGLALISTVFADDITDQIITQQPMAQRMAKVHYLDINAEVGKGNIPEGARLFDALRSFSGSQFYSDEKVNKEAVGAAGAVNYTPTLAYRPIIPGTVVIESGSLRITDDRNGNLVGDIGVGTNTVNYLTGAVDVDFSGVTTASVTASYSYNIEAALKYPEIGIALRQETVEARPRALSMTWSQQATFDFLSTFGIDAEPTLLDAAGRVIRAEQFKHVVNFLTSIATGGVGVFDNAAPAGVPYSLHIKTFAFIISRVQASVWQLTRVVRPNKVVISPDIWFLFAAQDGFQGEASTANDGIAGPRKIGALTRHGLDVYVDPTYTAASALLTHRGPDFATTAAIMGVYIPMYRSPIHAQGFRKDVSLLTEYVLHQVNSDQIATIEVTSL